MYSINFYVAYRKIDIHINIQYANKTNLNTDNFVSKTDNKKASPLL